MEGCDWTGHRGSMRAIKTQRVPTCVSELFVSLKVKHLQEDNRRWTLTWEYQGNCKPVFCENQIQGCNYWKKKSQSKKWRLFWKISSRKTSAAGNNPEISEPRIDLRAPRYYETCPSVLLLEGWTWGPGSEIQSQRTNKRDRRRWGRATHLPSEKKQKYLCSRITFSHYIHSTGTLSYL